MKATAQALSGLYDKHAGLVRTLLVMLIMMGVVVWLSIGNAVPAYTFAMASSGIEDPVLPNGGEVENLIGPIMIRVLGVILFIVGAVALGGALWRLLIWVGVLSVQSREGANKDHLRRIILLLAIFGITSASGTGLFIATANSFGTVINGVGG